MGSEFWKQYVEFRELPERQTTPPTRTCLSVFNVPKAELWSSEAAPTEAVTTRTEPTTTSSFVDLKVKTKASVHVEQEAWKYKRKLTSRAALKESETVYPWSTKQPRPPPDEEDIIHRVFKACTLGEVPFGALLVEEVPQSSAFACLHDCSTVVDS